MSYIGDEGDFAGAQAWGDLYDNLLGVSVTEPEIKSEPTAMSIDKLPPSEDADAKSVLAQVDGAELPDEHPTPKKIANLKQGLGSRASSSDRSSPANSTKGGTTGRKAVGSGSKKDTAKKPAAKKRKANDPEVERVDDGRRSNTPSSRASKTPAPKKQGSVSAAGSPGPEPKKPAKKKGPKNAAKQDDEENDEDSGEIFCICRRPDNHTWMIGCDGDCNDWFHGKCVNIDRRDAELIDKYICPNCHAKGKGRTSWKPMCRLPECRKPARVTKKAPSKYCSDDHGREFMRQNTKHLNLGAGPVKADDLGSRGGVLTAGELKAAITGVQSAEQFRRLGEHIISAPAEDEAEDQKETGHKEEGEGDKPETETPPQSKQEKRLGLDVDAKGLTYTPDEAAKLGKLRKRRDEILHRQTLLAARDTFITLVYRRSRTILDKFKQVDPKGGWKDICGFDARVAWADEEFDEWRISMAGEKALKEGSLDAPSFGHGGTDADGDTAMDDNNDSNNNNNNTNENAADGDGDGDGDGDTNDIETLSRGVCTKKRCERHKQWLKVHQEDILFEQNTARQDLKKCENEAQTVVERAVLRMWAEMENASVQA